MTAGLYKDRN